MRIAMNELALLIDAVLTNGTFYTRYIYNDGGPESGPYTTVVNGFRWGRLHVERDARGTCYITAKAERQFDIPVDLYEIVPVGERRELWHTLNSYAAFNANGVATHNPIAQAIEALVNKQLDREIRNASGTRCQKCEASHV